MKTGSPFIKWIAFIAAGVFIGSVAVLLSVEQMYFMAACLFLTPFVSLGMGRVLMSGLQAERRMPSTIDEGEEVDVELVLTNTGRFPKFFMSVSDALQPWIKNTASGGSVILHLEPGEERSVHYRLIAEKRGVYSVGPAVVAANDPFGFFTFKRTISGVSELVVYPSPLPLFAALEQSGAYGWRGESEGLRRGSGTDFDGVREYRYGDDLRRVHWRTTARTGKLAVAEYTQGETLSTVIALDLCEASYVRSGTGLDSAIEYAVKIAATLCEDLTRNGHTVRLLTPAHLAGGALPTNQGKWSSPLLEALARAEPTSKTTLAEALRGFRSDLERGTLLIYLTPAAADPSLVSALAECEERGAYTAGFVLDSASFAAPSRPTGTVNLDSFSSVAGPVRLVRRGDDLVEAIHDALGRGRRLASTGGGGRR